MEKFWIVIVESTDGGRHFKHDALENAVKEAERVAGLHLDTDVYLLECVGRCYVKRSPLEWESRF